MAQFGDSIYEVAIKSQVPGTNTTKTKSINYINFNGTGAGGGSSALGADVDMLYDFASSINGGIMAGNIEEISFKETKPITDDE